MLMDPNGTLRELREVQRHYEECIRNDAHPDERCTYSDRMSELVESLDRWLSHGGFLPAAWWVRSTPPTIPSGDQGRC